jgi:activator of 2-hydroxyglutaryl-CoA dehydratase
VTLTIPDEPQTVGALGAALLAAKFHKDFGG